MIALVTGGARSGKSRFAEQYAATLGNDGIYVATMERGDDEMRRRIALHERRRTAAGFFRETLEVPLELSDTLRSICVASRSDKSQERVILIDCLSLWLSNWLLCEDDLDRAEETIRHKVDELIDVLVHLRNPIVMVTNEVGDGIVPANPLGRRYRDLAGWMNQTIAQTSDYVFLVTAGIPVELKRLAWRPGQDDPQSFR